MKSNRKGLSVVPEATTVKLLGVVVPVVVMFDVQISKLVELGEGPGEEFGIGIPSIRQVQEGWVELKLRKAATTDTLVPRENIKPYKRLQHEILTHL